MNQMQAHVLSVNVGAPMPDPHKPHQRTGIDKRPVDQIVVFAPGIKSEGAGSGVRGDFIGDLKHHGGDEQAVYAVPREDLDLVEPLLGRLPGNGWMGENLTTAGIDADQSIVGERWRVGEVELQVTCPRFPCGTFRGWADRKGWLKDVTAMGRLGTYLSVQTPGIIRPGDAIDVHDVPDHGVTIQQFFWALTIQPELASHVLGASQFLSPKTIAELQRRAGLGDGGAAG